LQLQNQIVEQGQHGLDLLLALYEFWEWSERQPKATVNNQRLYEFFGYQWALPLWDAEMMDFWAKVPYEEKLNQKQIKILSEIFEVSIIEIRHYLPVCILLDFLYQNVLFKSINEKLMKKIKKFIRDTL
jgi:asparagine synthase (glutamine-hydrolysing)